ncbi:MAG: hypothetical protein RKO25_15565 [Candidatus Contendobacter sp.]|nr:hypothetical protein [Candidatus Contendobacter sp.]
MFKTFTTFAALSLALSIGSGCANDPSPSPDQSQPSYLNDDCSAQRQYEKKSCIPASAPPPPAILDYD